MSDPNPLFSQTYTDLRASTAVREYDYQNLKVVCDQCRTIMLKQNDDPTDSKFICPICKRLKDPIFELKELQRTGFKELTTKDGTRRGESTKFVHTFESVSQKRIREALTGKKEHPDVLKYSNLIKGGELKKLEVNGEVVYDREQ
jgi:hypothetical protein